MSRDLYEVLGVPGTASEAEIRHAFWALAKKYHPDVNPGDPAAARRFVEVGNAAETLLDPRRRASYDESRLPAVPGGPTGTPAAAPKPPPPRTAQRASTPQPARTPPSARTPQPAASKSARQSSEDRYGTLVGVAVVVMLGGFILFAVFGPPNPKHKNQPANANGTVVWKAAGFSLDDGWGINLAGNGTRIQIVPGTSTDIEVTGGNLVSAGHIMPLPPGETLTYQNCVNDLQQPTSQTEPLSAIEPGFDSRLCVFGSGGDLASVQVTRDDGSSLSADITVWEDV